MLVFGLLIGLVSMHGLAFGASAGTAGGQHSSHFSHFAHSSHSAHSAVGDMRLAMADMWGRSGGDETVCRSDSDSDSGGGSGHARHADVNCASAAVGAGAGLSAPSAASLGVAAQAVDGHRSVDIGREGGRAPPSLSELQLLRI